MIFNPPQNISGQFTVASTSSINNPRYSLIFDESTTNLIPNPSFEVNTTGWSAFGANASILRVTTQKSSGDASLQIAITPAATLQGATSDAISITAGLNYVFSIDVKGNVGGENILLKADFDSGTDVVGGAYVLSTSFNRLRLSFTAPVGSTTVQLQLLTSGVQEVTWFCDAAQLEQRSSMTSYCDGSMGMGYSWSGTPHNSTSSRVAGFKFLAPLNSNTTSRWGIKPDGTIGISKLIFRADETPGITFSEDSPFIFQGNVNAFSVIGSQNTVLKTINDGNGPSLWVKSASTTDIGMVLEIPNMTSGIGFGIAAPSDLSTFTGEYFSFVTKAGLRQYQLSKTRFAIGGVNDSLQKYILLYGGGGYTTALQSDFTGTVSVSAASAIVTGSGTTFTTQYKIDDTIVIDTGATKVKRRVISIASNTSLTTHANYTAPLSGVTHTQPVTQYAPAGIMIESSKGDHANLTQGDYQNFLWFNSADRPKFIRSSAVNTTVLPTADTDGLYITHELNRVSAQTVIASTAVETAAYSVTIPANRLGSRGQLRLKVFGRFLYNNNAANTIRLRVKYGSTTMIDSTALVVSGGVSATRRAFEWETHLTNVNATNSQKAYTRLMGGQDTTAFNSATDIRWSGYGTAAVDSQVDQTLALTVEWGTSSANNSFEVEFAILEAV